MATLFELSPKIQAWIDGKSPPALKALIEKRPFNLLYRFKPTGARAILVSYAADGTAVNLALTYNEVAFDHRMLGISPDDIEECNLPNPDQFLGAPLSEPASVFAAVGNLVRSMSA